MESWDTPLVRDGKIWHKPTMDSGEEPSSNIGGKLRVCGSLENK